MPECVMEQACAVDQPPSTTQPTQPIYLEPFLHQVGGHSSMLRFDETTVCKPLVPREQSFYETMPDEMKEFTPQYRGVTKVQFAEDSEGYLTLVAYPIHQCGTQFLDGDEVNSGSVSPVSGDEDFDGDSPSDSDSESTPISPPRPRQRFRIRRSGSIEMEASKKSKTKVHNPWYLRCYKVQLEKMRKSGMDTGAYHKFILLENLASDYKWPCILDLKMGTRQHGDDASEEKRLLHTQKCQDSTSSSLGTRLCGMQSYQMSSGQYICLDKYYGRTLSVAGMKAVLRQFVHNGLVLRRDIVVPLLERLRALSRILTELTTFRFYSSSLLLMYDGGDWSEGDDGKEKTCDVCNGGNSDKYTMHCDQDSSTVTKHWLYKCPHIKQPKVDIRMIDFAHVTHYGFRGDKIQHEGPDHGYLFGLKNLIKIFEEILENESYETDFDFTQKPDSKRSCTESGGASTSGNN